MPFECMMADMTRRQTSATYPDPEPLVETSAWFQISSH